MQQKYVFSHNGIWNFLRGLVPIVQRGSTTVAPMHNQHQTFVWRNHYLEGFKISPGYLQEPLDLSHYLLIRTREVFLLSNKVHMP